MVTGKQCAVAGALLAITVGALFFLWPRDAAQIRKQFAVLADNIAKTPGENQLVGAANAKRIRRVFAEVVTIRAPAYDYHRELAAASLPALVLSARSPYTDLSLTFYDHAIAFSGDDLAQVRVTARLRGRLASGEGVEDIQELNCRLRKVDGTWRFEAIDVVEVLQK